uniref:Uncharacterized protein n=1 Tax=Laticauda laticaudata TaxID=8630 RepID=A0A8C5SBX5_LATLA
MVGLSRLADGGLLLVLALLPLALDGKPAPPPQALPQAPAAASAPSRLLRVLPPDSKESQAAWDRMVRPENHAGGKRHLQAPSKKWRASSCFGQKLDRIGSLSGLGCSFLKKARGNAPRLSGWTGGMGRSTQWARGGKQHPKSKLPH